MRLGLLAGAPTPAEVSTRTSSVIMESTVMAAIMGSERKLWS